MLDQKALWRRCTASAMRSALAAIALLFVLGGGCKPSDDPAATHSGGAAGASGSGGAAGAGLGGAAGATADGGSALPAPGPDPDAPTRLAKALVGPCGGDSTDAAIEALARAGIETHDDVTGALIQDVTPPARGLRVSRTQARGMGCEIGNKGGTTGALLNAMVGPLPLEDGSKLPFSTLLAAYVTTKGAFGGELGQALMGAVEPARHAELVYPSLVLTTFLREVMLPMLAMAPQAGGGDAGSTFRALDPCQAISDFLNELPAAVTKAVGSLAPAEQSWWSTVVAGAAVVAGIATYAVVEVAKTVIQHAPFVDVARQALLAGSAIADLRAMFTQWKLKIEPAPPSVHKTVEGAAPSTGALTLTVEPPEPSFDWPPQVKSCAELLAVELPNFTADGASVVWTELAGFPAPATKKQGVETLAGGKAAFSFTTVTESASVHGGGGAEKSTPAQVKADVGLPGLEALGKKLAGLMNAPAVADGMASGAAQLIGPSTTGAASITYHQSTAATIDVSIGGVFVLHLASCAGLEGPYTGTATLSPCGGSKSVTLVIDPTTKSGPLSVGFPIGCGCTGIWQLDSVVTIGGTPTSPTAAFNGAVTGNVVCPGGGGPLTGPAVSVEPIALGPSAECP